MQPCEPRFHPAALRHYGGSLLGGLDELIEENAQLRQRIAELESQLVDYYDLKKENAQLYEYLDMDRAAARALDLAKELLA